MIKKGAYTILISMVTGLIAWGASTVHKNTNRLTRLEAREQSQKELILRVDRKVDKLDSKVDRILERVK